MKAVTTGLGVSGTFADTLEALVGTMRTDTGDQRWHIHMQVVQAPEYSLRVYAPDRHSQLHKVTMTVNTAKEIRAILVNEAKSWELRIRPVLKIESASLATTEPEIGDRAAAEQLTRGSERPS